MPTAPAHPSPFDSSAQQTAPETLSLESVIAQATSVAARQLRVALPAKIVRVLGEQQVDVQPMYQVRFVGQPPMDMPILHQVPVLMPRGGDWRIHYPLAAGDAGAVLIFDRNLDNYLASSGTTPVDPDDSRAHVLADAVFMPGLGVDAAQTTGSGDALMLRNGHSTVRLHKDGTVQLQNTNDELVGILDGLAQAQADVVTQLQRALVLTAFGPAPFTADTLAALSQQGAAIAALQARLRTFLVSAKGG